MTEVELFVHTPNPEEVLKNAYGQCYQREASIQTVIKHLHHQSVLEHVSYTFNMKISRVAWEQMVRHRVASYTAQSHRYTEPSYDDYISYIPPGIIALGEGAVWEWKQDMSDLMELYEKWRKRGVKKQDVRYIAPKGVAIRAQVTMNLRAMINFLQLRLGISAQQEIRYIANMMWEQVKPTLPELAPHIENIILNKGEL